MNPADFEQTPEPPHHSPPIGEAGTITRLRRTRPLTFVAGFVAAIVLTGGGAAAYAANGGSLLIGRSNSGRATTTLSNSGGTVLKLKLQVWDGSPRGQPHHQGDQPQRGLLDGRSDASYAPASGQSGVIFAEAEWVDLDEDLVNDALLAIAVCPEGTKLTGSGVDNFKGRCDLLLRSRRRWRLIRHSGSRPCRATFRGTLRRTPSAKTPRGAVPGAMSRGDVRSASPQAIATERLARMLAKR